MAASRRGVAEYAIRAARWDAHGRPRVTLANETGRVGLFRVISLNANGIRAAARKGFFGWMSAQDADVVCIQETKAQIHQLTDECFSPSGYHCVRWDCLLESTGTCQTRV